MPRWLSNPFDDNMIGVKIIAGNLVVWFNTFLQSTLFADTTAAGEFRAWTSWGFGVVISVFTIRKYLIDRRAAINLRREKEAAAAAAAQK